ncbi:MAG: ABC transporter permease [Cyanobacteriota bacterium]|nr:ABC transporter permease [Cyanobacteriota bacterium]
MITQRQRRQLGNQVDGTSVGLAALVGAAISLGLIELLASPLDQIGGVNIQVLAVQTTLLAAPLLISLMLLLRDGGVLVSQGALLARRHPRWLRRLWLAQLLPLVLTSLVLALYLLAAAMVSATLTQPDRNSIGELGVMLGSLEPASFVLALLKTAVFAALTLWICLQQGARCQRQRLQPMAALSRAISLTMALLLGLDLALVLAFDPLLIRP